MQTLIFNTTTKQVKLLADYGSNSMVPETFDNVSTVRCSELGFYEIMQKLDPESYTAIPVMRVPIANTNMVIEK